QRDTKVSDALSTPEKTPFSRLPIFGDNLDAVTGFVLREDLLVAQNQGKGDLPVSTFQREIVAVLSSTLLSRLLETLLEQRQHMVLVEAEYGETKGVVTLADVVETRLGIEILVEGDKVADMQQMARQLWAKRAERMGITLHKDEDGDAE